MKGKKSEQTRIKWPRNPMVIVLVALLQRCSKVLITSESDAVTTSEADVGTALIFDRVTTL